VLPESHPLCLGGAGLSPKADGILLPLFRQADLILLAGYDPIEMRPGWREVWDPARQHVIDIVAERNTHYMHQASLTIEAPVTPVLATLTGSAKPAWSVAETKAALALAFPEDEDWGPAAVIAECRAAFPGDTLASVDSGAHRILLSQMWRCAEPRGLVQSTGLCTMGCALPLAIGLKHASPDRPVVAFTGDAGLLMIAGELGTLADLGQPITIVVFVDRSLALIEKKQRERQLPNKGVDFGPTDFTQLAGAFGGTGVTVRDRPALRLAITEALGRQSFTLIAAEIEKGAYDGRI
jgi:acetolactate synthase-1/2/3 large subunit